MFCTSCGGHLAPGKAFCTNCGQKVKLPDNNASSATTEELTRKAESGDPIAMVELANRLIKTEPDGDTSEEAFEIALDWIERAAELGNEEALYELGDVHMAKDDPKEAFNCWEKSAKKNHSGAQYNLGICYLRGVGTFQSNDKAFYWIEKAASQGRPNAIFELGKFYAKGIGVAPNEQKAIALAREAARKGDIDAKNMIDKFDS